MREINENGHNSGEFSGEPMMNWHVLLNLSWAYHQLFQRFQRFQRFSGFSGFSVSAVSAFQRFILIGPWQQTTCPDSTCAVPLGRHLPLMTTYPLAESPGNVVNG